MKKRTKDQDQTQHNLFNVEIKQPLQKAQPKIVDAALKHYREHGFPYITLTDEEKKEEFDELKNLDVSTIIDGKTIQSHSAGTGLANSYFQHRYGVVCNNHRTAIEVFKNDESLRKCIEKCIAMNGKISDSSLRSMLSIFEGTQVASNFPPGTAKAIYEYFLPNPGVVWDMSCGWGGRLLAASTTDSVTRYYGTEPSSKTYEGLTKMMAELCTLELAQLDKFSVYMEGSETIDVSRWFKTSVNFCFTSPPYFNCEKYAMENTQSFIRYTNQGDWLKYFLGKTLENCLFMLPENGGIIAINIANVESFKDLEKQTVKTAERVGLKLLYTYQFQYTMMPGGGKKNKQSKSEGQYRTEPLFIFTKK
jgi:hypothetical protein